jgi:hypothetical protein
LPMWVGPAAGQCVRKIEFVRELQWLTGVSFLFARRCLIFPSWGKVCCSWHQGKSLLMSCLPSRFCYWCAFFWINERAHDTDYFIDKEERLLVY